MKIKEITNIQSLVAYCKYNNRYPHSPITTSPKYDGDKEIITFPNGKGIIKSIKSNANGSIAYVLFESPIRYGFTNIRGIIYSYDTPIGIIMGYNLYIVSPEHITFKSVTTKRILNILIKQVFVIEYNSLMMFLKLNNIRSGWWNK